MVLRGAPVVVVAGEGVVGGGLQRAVVAPCLPGRSVVMMMGVCRIALARGEEKASGGIRVRVGVPLVLLLVWLARCAGGMPRGRPGGWWWQGSLGLASFKDP